MSDAMGLEATGSEATTMWLPGVEDQLGFGINIFKGYFQSRRNNSKCYRMIDATAAGETETISPFGKEYRKPKGVIFGTGHGFDGKARVFSSKAKVTQHWQESADVKGSYGAFSGGINESFTSSEQSEANLKYCACEKSSVVYSLRLVNPSHSMIPKSVLDDRDFAEMEELLKAGKSFDSLDEQKKDVFFSFFHRYGTHFIQEVTLGGYLNYYCSASKSYAQTDREFEAQVEAEYAGLTANASGSWSKVTENWMKQRNARLVGHGGDPRAKLLAGLPENWNKNTTLKENFEEWVKSVPDYPSPVGYKLQPIFSLYPRQQAALMEQAYKAYADARILIKGPKAPPLNPRQPSIWWRGAPVVLPQNVRSAFWVVIDREKGKPGIIAQPNAHSVPDEVKALQQQKPLVVFCYPGGMAGGSGVVVASKIGGELLAFLQRNCGAGETLNEVLSWKGWPPHGSPYESGYYCLAGIMGSRPNSAAEGETLVHHQIDFELDVPVIRESTGHKMLYTIVNW